MNNPFERLGPYESRNLIAHLQVLGRCEEIDRILAMETDERGNAWFELCDHRGDVRGYLADVDRAWRLAEQRAAVDQVPGSDCGRQVRYGLLTASVNSRALNISGPLLEALVRNDLWSSDQAMAYLRQMPQPAVRADGLRRLAPYVPQAALREAIELATRGANPWEQSRALVGLLPRQAELGEAGTALRAALLIEDTPTCGKCLTAVLRHSPVALVAQAEKEAGKIADPERRAFILQAVWGNLPDRPKSEAVEAELSAVSAIERPDSRARALAAIAPYLGTRALRNALHAILADKPGWRPESIGDLLPRLAELGHPREAVALLSKVRGDRQKLGAIAGMTPHLPGSLRAKTLRSALNFQSESAAGEALRTLTPLLDVRLLRLAATAARRIRSAPERAQTLAAIARKLCAAQANELIQEALTAVRAQPPGYVKAFYLGAVAAYLPERLQGEVFAEALDSIDGPQAWSTFVHEVIPSLAPHLPKRLLRLTLSKATQLHDQPAFVEFLIELTPYLPSPRLEELIGRIVGALESARDPVIYANGLADLFQHLTEPRRSEYRHKAVVAARLVPPGDARTKLFARLIESSPEVTDELLDAARALPDARARSEGLVATLRHVSEEEKPQLTAEALAAVLAIKNESRRAEVFARSARAFPPDMSATMLAQALKVAELIHDPFMRIMALLEIAPELPDRDRSRALLKALDSARAVRKQQVKAQLLVMIAPKLAQFGMFKDAQKVIDEIKERDLRLRAIGGVLAWAAAAAPPEQRERTMTEALDSLRHLEPNEVAQAISALAPHLPTSLMGIALTAAAAIADRSLRKRALSGLATRAVEVLSPDVRASWSGGLHGLAARTRRDLWSDLGAAVALLTACGTATTAESARAAMDVCDWWP